MDEFEQAIHTLPIEMAANVVPEGQWNVEPRYMPPGYEDNPDMSLETFRKVAPIFGERVTSDGQIEACDIAGLEAIHQEVAVRILIDEHSRPAKRINVPQPYKGSGNPENNDVWYITIRDGNWGLPGSYKQLSYKNPTFATKLSYDPHDTADKHIVFMLLAAREMQDQITTLTHLDIDPRKGLVLPGERPYENDSLAYSWRGTTKREDINAMGVVDEISDDRSFLPLMEDLLELTSSEDRQSYMRHYARLASLPTSELDQAIRSAAIEQFGEQAVNEENFFDMTPAQRWMRTEAARAGYVDAQMRCIVAVTNFNTRHLEKRNMTEAEQQDAKQAYMMGLIRVAAKLCGDYIPE